LAFFNKIAVFDISKRARRCIKNSKQGFAIRRLFEKDVNIRLFIIDEIGPKMKYVCKQCGRTFHEERAADSHENESGHKVELFVGSTYWGDHLTPVMQNG
jgi:hypothetical protein